jgi:UDP-N-acetylglucosamine:LPS N-acetylglucosamine transferase
MSERKQYPRVIAAASTGGHWEQLMLLRPALDAFDVHYVTTDARFAERDGLRRSHVIADGNRSRPLRIARTMIDAMRVVRKVRPDVVITTGALPGLACIIAGHAIGARTIWIDSLANAERLSMSGRLARRFATLRLTQWEHLADPAQHLDYFGSLL